MTYRARHEHQIKLTERIGFYRGSFEKALLAIIYQRGTPDLSWLTDEQIEQVRAEMIGREWSRHKRGREIRQQWAASASLSASQKEHA